MLIHLFELPEASSHRKHLVNTLGDPFTLVSNLLHKLVLLLPLPGEVPGIIPELDEKGGRELCLRDFIAECGVPQGDQEWESLAIKMYRATLKVLPSCARMWFADLNNRSLATNVEAYTTANESPALIQCEFASVEVGQVSWISLASNMVCSTLVHVVFWSVCWEWIF